LEGKKQHLIGN